MPIQATQQITVAHDQNYFTVKFAALEYNRPAKNRYRYRLEGRKWSVPEAISTNLSPVNYVLVLNAANTSGRWSQHIRKLRIRIQPPVRAIWWAYAQYCLVGLGISWG